MSDHNLRQQPDSAYSDSNNFLNARSMASAQTFSYFNRQNDRPVPSSPSFYNPRSLVSEQSPSPFTYQNVRQTVAPSFSLSNPSSMVPGRSSSSFSCQNAIQIVAPSSNFSNPSSVVPGQHLSSFNCQNYARQTVPASSHLPNPRSMVPAQVSSGFYLQNVRQRAPQSPSLSNSSSMMPAQVSSHFYMQNPRRPPPSSSRLSSPSSMVQGQVSSPFYLENARNTALPSPYFSKRATGSTMGIISTELLHSSSVSNDKLMSGTSWSPIEVPDSPSREISPYQHNECQRAKRAREEESEFQVCIDQSDKIKKTKMMHQSQNQSIKRPQNENKLPSLQTSSDCTNCPAACDDTQFEEKDFPEEEFVIYELPIEVVEEMLATTTVERGVGDFFYEGETLDDFIGMEDIKEVALFRY